MMQSRLRLIAIPVALALTVVACSESRILDSEPPRYLPEPPADRPDPPQDSTELPQGLPEPVQEPKHAVPNSERIYYKPPTDAYYHESLESYMAAMEAHLEEVLDAEVGMLHAWVPIHVDLCMAMGSVTVIIIETDQPYDGLADFGWITNPPGYWLINCGVPEVWHYDFDSD